MPRCMVVKTILMKKLRLGKRPLIEAERLPVLSGFDGVKLAPQRLIVGSFIVLP